ncbi:Protein translocase subunit YajC [hydrothermal vent metagenome]|uniref:Protein translocase subunit YajC n=1 Tax=hydrothermal vent metagenome TaxID=652676 RepID=A0A3B0U177_9ZZZZ
MNYILMTQPAGGESNPLTSFLPLILIVVVFYFFMIRPQMKRQKDMRKFRENLAKGDKVVTTGGIYGKVVDIKESIIILQIDKEVNVKVDKSAVIKDMSDAPQRK